MLCQKLSRGDYNQQWWVWDVNPKQLQCCLSYSSILFCVFVHLQECIGLQGHFVGTACGHHGPYTPDVLFWSAILFFATVFMSAFLKECKTSRYFPTRVRHYNTV